MGHMRKVLVITIVALAAVSCSTREKESNVSEEEQWRLGWRMVFSSMDENHELAESQFDSLLIANPSPGNHFLITGFATLRELKKEEKLEKILSELDVSRLSEICNHSLFTEKLKDIAPCRNVELFQTKYPDLQLELVKMYVNDQAVRDNLMNDLIEKYHLNLDEVIQDAPFTVDATNRNRLKEIFQEYGFPTKEMVGKDAMNGIFLMIQHSDRDKEWQKSQLGNIETAVKRGDMDGQSYAYLYDRIKINGGESQLYGTQFSDVDPENNTATLAETEDLDRLDERRMQIGMMPIEMYKEFMLRNLRD